MMRSTVAGTGVTLLVAKKRSIGGMASGDENYFECEFELYDCEIILPGLDS